MYKKGKYDKIDFDILNHIIKYGNAYEYVYVNKAGKITNKLIQPENGFPIYNNSLEMIAFVEFYVNVEADWYVIYSQERGGKWSNTGDFELKLVSQF
ncbi:phage portal protein [Bacillus cereus]|nr:phage portal protein [Bacillus cereus]MDA2079725.1 phage portal protein [Bacillus cereus]MDA2085315.1 phage portal protein [Bacillus cereus]